MSERRQTVEHPFGTIKSWMGATHFQMKTLKHVGAEMALHVLAYVDRDETVIAICAGNSLLTGKRTGNFAISVLPRPISLQETAAPRSLLA
jgi:hypothetical protein